MLLAQLDDADVRARYALAASGPRGARDVADLAALLEELAEIRESGIAWNFEDSEDGVTGLAIAVGPRGGAQAALTIGVPAARFDAALGVKLVRDLREVAEAVARSDRA